MRQVVLFISSFILLSSFYFNISSKNDPKKYLVKVDHPAFDEDQPNEFFLWEWRRDSTKLEGYYLDAESVICVDHRCKIVPVRLYWDILGNYQKYELSENMILEKKEGEPFLPEDYDHLHEILLDKSSPYKDLSYYEITHEKIISEGEVDGISGATAVILDETKTIEGGAWTCYTLWHWANGEIVEDVKSITAAASSTEELLDHLRSTEEYRQLFALSELIKRNKIEESVVSEVVALGNRGSAEDETFKKLIEYLELVGSDVYFETLISWYDRSKKNRRISLLKSIMKYSKPPAHDYFDEIIESILVSRDYQELDLFLKVLDRSQAPSGTIIQKMVPLLEEEYSILNRRVYWYLTDKELTKEQKKILNSYYEEYSDYL